MALETGDLHASGDEVFLEVLRDFDGTPQRTLTLGTAPQRLLNNPIDAGGRGAGHPRMPGLLTGTLEAPEEGRQTRGLTFRWVEALGEPLDFLRELRDLALLLVDERDELAS